MTIIYISTFYFDFDDINHFTLMKNVIVRF